MSKYQISQKRYNSLLKELTKLAEDTSSEKVFALNKKLSTADNVPTIRELEEHNIGEFMTEEVLQLLMFYGEEKCVDKENDVWVPIYTPDPNIVPPDEFDKLRKYCARIIIRYVDII